jgi:hypothetical protein
LRTRILTGVVAGGILLGSAGAALILPSLASAANPSAAPAASPSTTGTQGTNPGGPGGMGGPGRGGFGMGGHNEAVSDASVAAKAIGITESALTTELQAGKTMADVAKAHNVTVQTVIDALVADAKDELAAAVKAGTITQAQADTESANVVARVTAQVNGTFGPGGMGGPGGDHRGPGGWPGSGAATPSASPTTGG